MRQASVYLNEVKAGIIQENDDGDYVFYYLDEYLKSKTAQPISLTLPLQSEHYRSKILFPFFDGLIPEGWLLELSLKNWKLQSRDRMGLLLTSCEDCIGNVSIREVRDA